ncbi:hypothetical protein AN5394.2 [Aspergillus nidulans FGSC A4]|uniref:CorA family metal ion transporter (Eurofung) n=1 Tax=Emericella nidulans (strain FGSC A4 / ATCC 38163 / CBS 112.46 / NRRL 194 / M139) TaxID=227321 RepID=Q5B236_EMENI|nr:hypothetical protein [Aspergillus nidulans FGSC A4]EAA62554.1 hypothetical protein AN5394.2 [Aspergillus nidulans FGSC A4]CBF81981.1 TPA: conserved hypothetical protein [Aspergillus nidulans FGSC A4]|eukprot:XP_662998.1 hypothetical protein AN5394.2 [Aspergillus nidulans FGSC A4]
MDQVFNDPVALRPYIQDPTDPAVPNTQLEVLDWVDAHRVHSPRAYKLPISSTDLTRFLEPKWPLDGLPLLIEHYKIPTAFFEGGIRAVTHSFGSLDTEDGYRCCWFDYLCKNITVAQSPGPEPVISDQSCNSLPQIRQSDFTWTRAGFFLRWPIRSENRHNLTMVYFGANMVYDRLTRLSCEAVKEGVIHDPMSLLVVVLHQLSARMDETVWNLSMVFGGIESKALGLHRDRESFTGLHNISKHIIYLQESSDAALETVKNLHHHHKDLSPSATEEERAAGNLTRRTMAQIEAEFQTVRLRLRSLDRRMQNVIALSFHLVTQEGNELIQADSSTMATIAFVTLVFLPITTVSTIFGSQFFNTAPDNASIEVSKDFWIFWVVSIPLTLAVLLGWSLWQRKALVGSHIARKGISGPSNSSALHAAG